MSATKHVTLWCDDEKSPQCHGNIQCAAETFPEAREEASNQGKDQHGRDASWVSHKIGSKTYDFCPACIRKARYELREAMRR